jgi:TPR repeat protein
MGQKRQLLPLAAQAMHSRPRVKDISTELSLPQTARVRREICSPAAERSNAKGESVLGAMYATGYCVPRDLPLAYRWFAKALRQESDNARFEGNVQILWNQMTPDERQTAMRPQ